MKVKQLVVRDGRAIAKFLIKTGLKATLFEMMFPKDNQKTPKDWMQMREHLQKVHGMSDQDYRSYKESINSDLEKAVSQYASDFVIEQADLGEKLVDIILDVFAEDDKFDATIDFLAYMFEIKAEEVENMSVPELISLIRSLLSDSGFLALLQPSEQVIQTSATQIEA